jgi:hypothetical protein
MSYYCSVQRAVSHDYFLHTLFFMGKRSLVGPEYHPSIFSRESTIFSMEKKLLQFLTKGHENNPRNDIPHRIIRWKQIIQKMTNPNMWAVTIRGVKKQNYTPRS